MHGERARAVVVVLELGQGLARELREAPGQTRRLQSIAIV